VLIIINSVCREEWGAFNFGVYSKSATMGKQRDKREGVIREEREVEKEKKKILVRHIYPLFNGK
jgi:hypothetical protein